MKKLFIILVITISLMSGGLITNWVLNYYDKTSSDALFGLAMKKYENKQVNEAIEILFQSIEMNSDNYGSYFFLANIFNEHSEYQASCYFYRQALKRVRVENVREIKYMKNILVKKCKSMGSDSIDFIELR